MHAFGFFRPYTTDRGGVAPEPWHLSYAPVAARAQARVRRWSGCARCSRPRESRARRRCWPRCRANFANYVVNVDAPPEAALLSQARLRRRARLQAQPQTFLIAPSISVRVVAIESSTPVNTGG